jgi:hypothetical protein
MRPGLYRLAGAPDGSPGGNEGPASHATFNSPRDIVLSADEEFLYIADYNNRLIRYLNIDSRVVNSIVGFAAYPKHLALSPDGTKLLVTADDYYGGDDLIYEVTIATGSTATFTSTVGKVGAIAYSPLDDGTATVRCRINAPTTGWCTLKLADPGRGTFIEPPTIPDPPYCDPPTNSIPISIYRMSDGDFAADAGVAYVGPVVIAIQQEISGTGAYGFMATDPWDDSPFPSPYTTCTPTGDPAGTVTALTDEEMANRMPWQLVAGPDAAGGLPTIVGAAWISTGGIVQRATIDTSDTVNPIKAVDFTLSQGLHGAPVVGIAYSWNRDTFYFSTSDPTNTYAGIINGVGLNQIVELTLVPDPAKHSGGSGRLPIHS